MNKQKSRKSRHQRIRKKIIGTSSVPRLTVFRSNKYIYAQIVDDTARKTLIASSDLKLKKGKDEKINKSQIARQVGKDLAQKAAVKKIKKVVFDRGGYKYHGRTKALAEGAREGGLIF